MFRKMWKVYGKDGQSQEMSPHPSVKHDWSERGRRYEHIRILGFMTADITGTDDCVVVDIIENSENNCNEEFTGQLLDGFFENAEKGPVVELKPFKVSFKYSASLWCTNLCYAEAKEDVSGAYGRKYAEVIVHEAGSSDMRETFVKEMPCTCIIDGNVVSSII